MDIQRRAEQQYKDEQRQAEEMRKGLDGLYDWVNEHGVIDAIQREINDLMDNKKITDEQWQELSDLVSWWATNGVEKYSKNVYESPANGMTGRPRITFEESVKQIGEHFTSEMEKEVRDKIKEMLAQ